jgi:hypothetical protein
VSKTPEPCGIKPPPGGLTCHKKPLPKLSGQLIKLPVRQFLHLVESGADILFSPFVNTL